MEPQFTFPEIISKAERYCALAEKCQFEVEQKLKSWGANYEQIDQIVAHLIAENFINELRYAKAYTNDSIRLKSWGRIKIQRRLIEKRISKYSIDKAFQDFPEEEYLEVANNLISKSWENQLDNNKWNRWAKVERFIKNRGFEHQIIATARARYLD